MKRTMFRTGRIYAHVGWIAVLNELLWIHYVEAAEPVNQHLLQSAG